MKVTLSFEKTITSDVSIMVDALRASTTISLALNKYKKIIPCFTKEEAFIIAKKTGGVLAGERNGLTIEGFDVGNSPEDILKFKTDSDTLVLTTSNGTRIMENMNSTVLVGAFVNSEAVAKASIKIAKKEIDVVMAGYKGHFALEDFLASGEILYLIEKNLKLENKPYKLNDEAVSAILASRNAIEVKKAINNSVSGKKLKSLNSQHDIDCCLKNNITKNVAIYNNKILKLID